MFFVSGILLDEQKWKGGRVLKKEKHIFQIAGIVLLAAGITGSTAAYLSLYTQSAENTITAGLVEIELKEEHWDKAKAQKVYPAQVLEKDPAIKNTGDRKANVFLEVGIPVRELSVVDPGTGRKSEKEERELFQFQADENSWEFLKKELKGNQMCYVYGYRKILEPEDVTSPLFHEVQMISYLEGELDETQNYEIPVIAKGIQALAGELSLKEIYEEYAVQYDLDRREVAE